MKLEFVVGICSFCICVSILCSGFIIAEQTYHYEYERIINITSGGGSWETIDNEQYFSYQLFLDTGYSEMYVVVPGITNLYVHQPYYNETCWIRYSSEKLGNMPILIDLQLLESIKSDEI